MDANARAEENANSAPPVSNNENVQNANEEMAKRLRYKSLNQFININEHMLSELGFDKDELDEEKLLVTHFYKESKVANPEYTFPRNYDSTRFRSRLVNIIKKMNRTFGRTAKTTKYNVRFLYGHEIEKEITLIADFNVVKPIQKPRRYSKTDRAKHKNELKRESLQYIGIVYNSETHRFKVVFENTNLRGWLLSELNAAENKDVKDVSWKMFFDNLIGTTGYEITELTLCKSDVNQRDSFVLRPVKSKTMPNFIKKFTDSGTLVNPDLSYIQRMRFRLPGKAAHTIEFVRPDVLSIQPRFTKVSAKEAGEIQQLELLLGFKNKQILIDTHRDPLEEIFDDVGVGKKIKGVQRRQWGSYDVVNNLEKRGFVRLGDVWGHSCKSDEHGLKIFYSNTKLKRCKYCPNKRLFRWMDTEVKPSYGNIAATVAKLLRSNNIRSKLVQSMKIYSKKYDFILSKYKDADVFLFFNKDGITKGTEEDFLIDTRPFVLLNFSGELKTTLEDYSHLSGGKVLRIVKDGDISPLLSGMEEAVNKYKAGALASLTTSVNKLKEIRDNNADAGLKAGEKGVMFEKLVRPCFSALFNSKPLSSRNRPDGVFFLNQNDYVLWDAKRYDSDKSTLIKNIKKSNGRLPKDTRYIKRAITLDKLLKRKLRFYMFVTKDISKTDFDATKTELQKHGRKARIKTEIVCLDLKGLIALGEAITTPSIYDTIIKEKERFINEFAAMLTKYGFVGEDQVKELVDKFKASSIEQKLDAGTFTAQ